MVFKMVGKKIGSKIIDKVKPKIVSKTKPKIKIVSKTKPKIVSKTKPKTKPKTKTKPEPKIVSKTKPKTKTKPKPKRGKRTTTPKTKKTTPMAPGIGPSGIVFPSVAAAPKGIAGTLAGATVGTGVAAGGGKMAYDLANKGNRRSGKRTTKPSYR